MNCEPIPLFPFHCLNDTELRLHIYDFDISDSSHDLQQVLELRNSQSLLDCDSIIDLAVNNFQSVANSKFITTEEIPHLNNFPDSMSILQINCRSLSKNFDHLKNLLCNFQNKPSLISLSETWIKPSDDISLFALSGYTFVSTHRKHKRVRGT